MDNFVDPNCNVIMSFTVYKEYILLLNETSVIYVATNVEWDFSFFLRYVTKQYNVH